MPSAWATLIFAPPRTVTPFDVEDRPRHGPPANECEEHHTWSIAARCSSGAGWLAQLVARAPAEGAFDVQAQQRAGRGVLAVLRVLAQQGLLAHRAGLEV